MVSVGNLLAGWEGMNQPKVSVIMGIYNCEKTLSEAIESIIRQTYENWELVMCDDGSTDRTYAVADQYRKQFPEKIILLKNERNRKLSYTLNRCLQAARGELIARMDGDDISRSDRLQKQVDYLLSHPDLQVVGCAMQRFDEKGLHDIMHPVTAPDSGVATSHGSTVWCMKSTTLRSSYLFSLPTAITTTSSLPTL